MDKKIISQTISDGFERFMTFLKSQNKIKTAEDLVPKMMYDWFYFLDNQKGRIDCCLRSSKGFFPVVKEDVYDAIINIEYTPDPSNDKKVIWTGIYNHKINQPITEGWSEER